jgi:hypothetical protein
MAPTPLIPDDHRNPIHRALDFLLHHQAVHNPETAAEAEEHSEAIAGEFSPHTHGSVQEISK